MSIEWIVDAGSADGSVKQWSIASGVELDSITIGDGGHMEVE